MKLIIKVGSVTNAQRGAKILRSSGYKPQIKRLENPSQNDGCGYVLEVIASDNEPVDILKRKGINVKGVERIDLS